jgi:hypothetical protein
MLWRFMENDEIALTNNEAERALRGYVLVTVHPDGIDRKK